LQRIGIAMMLLLSLLLHFTNLAQDGLANLYYAAGVKSMMMNWHNFFFVSFDPGGFITIDKPPLGFWIQTLSAMLFGFKGWSLILPQALGGVISVYLVYVLVKRYYGASAGLLAGLTLALTPIFVAASRNNTIDGLLTMTLLFAAFVFLPSAEGLNLRKLLFAFFLIGVGFNIKSLEAYMILPAFYITYLFAQHGDYKKKVLHLIAATLVLIISSLPWFIGVDSISPEERPYVGSSEHNSELELATGYNGLGHFLGHGVKVPGRQGQRPSPRVSQTSNNPSNSKQLGARVGETGAAGVFRLFNRQIGGQIGWMLPVSLIGVLIAFYQYRKKILFEKSNSSLLFWSCWLIPQVIFFSIAQGFHRYYLVVMAPGAAALVGICYSILANWIIDGGKKRYILPLTLFITTGIQIWILSQYNEWHWMLFVVAGIGAFALMLLVWLVQSDRARQSNQYKKLILLVSTVSLLMAPFAWSITPVLYGAGNPSFPFAGPDLSPESKQINVPGKMPNLSSAFMGANTGKLKEFLTTHRKGEKYLVAVPNANIAAPIILDTGESIITYGGFMGSEKILDVEKLQELVRSGQLRYIILGSSFSNQPEIDAWVSSHGTQIPDSEWQSSVQENTNGVGNARQMRMMLYECHP
jgi:4-amino-4-deoxy-L-arabinose transferase-like glycosyltransferase